MACHRNGPDNEILWVCAPIRINVGPGKKMRDDLVLDQPNLGIYNYNYILLKKTLNVKVSEFQNGEKFFSKKTSKSTKQDKDGDFSGFTEEIVNFNFNNEA